MQQRQENKEKGKKQWTSNMARSESDGEENEGHQAMVRIGCRDRERREEEERVEGEKNAALAGRLEGARSDFGAEGCKARTIDWDENGQEQEWRKVPVCQGGVGVGSTSSYLLLHTLLRCSLCTFCVFSVYLYRTICFCRYCRYCCYCHGTVLLERDFGQGLNPARFTAGKTDFLFFFVLLAVRV